MFEVLVEMFAEFTFAIVVANNALKLASFYAFLFATI